VACLSLAADMLGEMAKVYILDLDWKTLVFFLLSVMIPDFCSWC
jgi:hypothetical protein